MLLVRICAAVSLLAFAVAADPTAAAGAQVPTSQGPSPALAAMEHWARNGRELGVGTAVESDSRNGEWVELPSPARWGHVAMLDPKGNRILAFGGFASFLSDELWERPLEPDSPWRRVNLKGERPAARTLPAAVYDSRRDRWILFGGSDGFTYFNDVWELRLGADPRWKRLTPGGEAPAGRLGHSAIYDIHSERVVIFGGVGDRSKLNDLWTLELRGRPTWRLLSPAGDPPAARYWHTALYDSARGRMLVMGGLGDLQAELSETVWELSLSSTPSWKLLKPVGTAPPSLFAAAGVLDTDTDCLLVFGGSSLTGGLGPTNDVWRLSLSSPMEWSKLDPGPVRPSPRDGHIAVLDPHTRRMWIHGGAYGASYREDTWALSLENDPRWSPMPPAGDPERRTGHTAVYDSRRRRMILYGGLPSSFGPQNPGPRHDLWIQDFSRGDAWVPLEPVGAAPPSRTFHVAIFDSLRDRMLIFGGGSQGAVLNDVWSLSLAGTPRWERVMAIGPAPEPRTAASAIYDPINDQMVVFGGGGIGNDTWALALSGAPVWRKLSPLGQIPPARREHTAIFDPGSQRMIIFGGNTSTRSYDNDVWALSLEEPFTWAQIIVPPPRPLGRSNHVAVGDPQLGRMIVEGGTDGANAGWDVWELTLSAEPSWRQLQPGGLGLLYWADHSGVFDPIARRLVLFGESASWSVVWGGFRQNKDLDHPFEEERMLAPATRSALGISVATNPTRGVWELRVEFPSMDQARLEVRNVAGRIVLAREISPVPGGASAIRLEQPRGLAPGVYWVRLLQGNQEAHAKVLVLR